MKKKFSPMYSKSTTKVVEDLISSVKLPPNVQKQLRTCLKTGSSLPVEVVKPPRPSYSNSSMFGSRPTRHMSKRTSDCISIPDRQDEKPAPGQNRESMINHLQTKMSGPGHEKPVRRFVEVDDVFDLFSELFKEVKDRFDFISSLDEHGKKSNETHVKFQIVSRLNEMRRLSSDRFQSVPQEWLDFAQISR
ncbi:hypothetical protein RCL1_003739 [Eukaryota sp. TZLM3-RCL]